MSETFIRKRSRAGFPPQPMPDTDGTGRPIDGTARYPGPARQPPPGLRSQRLLPGGGGTRAFTRGAAGRRSPAHAHIGKAAANRGRQDSGRTYSISTSGER